MLKEVFQLYLNRLVDLSARNRSLYLPKVMPSQMVDIKEMDFLNHHAAFEYVKAIVEGKSKIPLVEVADPRDGQSNLVSKRLGRIQTLAQTIASETGEKSTYVAWPYVEGKLINGQLVRCPLILFPVSLEKGEKHWFLQIRKSDAPVFNKAFLLAYQNAYGQVINAEDFDAIFEDILGDSVGFLNGLYDFIKNELKINFTRTLYEHKLFSFPNSAKSLDEDKLELGELVLKPFGVLGIFSQKTSFLIQDYEHLIKNPEFETIEELFFNYFSPNETIKSIREDQLYNCFPLDAYQEQVVKSVRSGRSVVVEGPPGTGKSQLISNLALDFISRGKKVLIVSQKKVALDVVFNRLESIGFGSFLALVHDFRSDRKHLFKKIALQIEAVSDYKLQNQSIDTIQLERQFVQLSRAIDNATEFFNDFKKALFNTEECNVPIKELYLESKKEENTFDLTQFYKKLPFDKVNSFLRNLKLYGFYYRKYQKKASFWLHRVSFSLFNQQSKIRLSEVFDEIHAIKEEVSSHFKKSRLFELPFLFSLYEQKSKLLELKSFLVHKDSEHVFTKIVELGAEKIDRQWLEQKFVTIKALLSEYGVEWTTQDKEVEKFLELSLEFKERGRGLFDWVSWTWKKKKYAELFQLFEKNGLSPDDIGNESLLRKLENRLNINHQITLLSQKPWLDMPPKPFGFSEFNHFSVTYTEAIHAKFLVHEWEELGLFLTEGIRNGESIHERIDYLLEIINRLEERIPHWSLFLSKIQIQHLFLENSDFDQLKKELNHTFEDLVAFDTLKEQLESDEIELIEKLWDHDQKKDYEGVVKTFLTGLRASWIQHIETKYPVLKEFSTPKPEYIQSELMDSVLEKWKLSKFISGLRVRENTFKNLEYNRLGNLVTYRELSHQVNKKKKIWSIKRLLEDFEDEIFQLLPCWLASPETVSALFPMKQEFDLVIFDESSQCFVERGFPAMLRGKQVVIAGDSQQLQPYDLYTIRIDNEEEGIDFETDSLLELCSSYFEKYWLQGHYRSSQKSLIEFSNKHFYDGRLGMLPDKHLINHPKEAFKIVKLDGIWSNQTNLEEAEEVIKELKMLQNSYPDERVGVITLNYFQMELIKDLIQREQGVSKDIEVKNIENVQGDEYDHVILSVGYAKNKGGRLIANFGLISKKGGTNRLNVAITRSRKSMTLITSLSPSDFKESQLKNEGILMLKKYIEFVEERVNHKKPLVQDVPVKGYQSNWYLKNRLLSDYGQKYINNFSESSWMDLAIIDDNQYVGALLTDDDRMYLSSGAKEAFAYHPIQLRNKNWPYTFYYSRQYWLGNDLGTE